MAEIEFLESWSERLGDGALGWAARWVLVAIIAGAANFVAKQGIVRTAKGLIKRTRTTWDDVFVEHRVFDRLSHLAPAFVLYAAAPLLLPDEYSAYTRLLQRLAYVWMILAGARALSAFVDALVAIGHKTEALRDKPLRSYSQVVKIVLWLGVAILTVGTLFDKSPWALLTGLGAMTAILLLVFKDSILGLVASIQIAGNDMLRAGDWVEMPKYGADGDVLEIGLHTVKVQNWDKTVTTIPTYAFMTDSFKNWRGMTESGGRRIKRSIALDMSSVHFLSEEELAALKQVQYLSDYLAEREGEIAQWNDAQDIDESSVVNGRRLTNLGSFRRYVQNYLERHPDIRDDMTFLVRQLAPGPEGLPIEIYVFSAEQRWVQYEAILADIFDHLLAVVGEFGLRVYQRPSGADLSGIGLSSR